MGHLRFALEVDEGGRGRPLDPEEADRPAGPGAAYRWLHVDMNDPAAAGWLAGRVGEVIARTLTLGETRPRFERHGDHGVLLILRGVNLNPNADPDDMVSIRIFATPDEIVSVRLRRLIAVVELKEALEGGDGPRDVGEFLVRLAAGLTRNMDGVIAELSDDIDALEDTSLDQASGVRDDLARARRTAIVLRRYIAPQRDALTRFQAEPAGLLGEDQRGALRETLDQVTRIVEELDALRERASVIHDQLTDRRAEEMNRNMLVLSVVAAVFLPLGFLTGLLGVNIAGIPGADVPQAFAWFCALLAVIAVGLLALFRKLDWL